MHLNHNQSFVIFLNSIGYTNQFIVNLIQKCDICWISSK